MLIIVNRFINNSLIILAHIAASLDLNCFRGRECFWLCPIENSKSEERRSDLSVHGLLMSSLHSFVSPLGVSEIWRGFFFQSRFSYHSTFVLLRSPKSSSLVSIKRSVVICGLATRSLKKPHSLNVRSLLSRLTVVIPCNRCFLPSALFVPT